MFALPLPTPNAASATSTPWACGATSSSSRSMLTTTSETLGSAKAPVLRRVTTTTFLHSGFLLRSCTMRPPTFPVAPSTIAEYCVFASAAAAAIVTLSGDFFTRFLLSHICDRQEISQLYTKDDFRGRGAKL